MALYYSQIPDRAYLSITGEDARTFLQGLITQDVNKVTATQCQYSALLSPQGRFLFDFFIYDYNGGLLLETNTQDVDALKRKLTMYKLRSKVTLSDPGPLRTLLLWGDGNTLATTPDSQDIIISPDPRSTSLGWRVVGAESIVEHYALGKNALPADYENWRIKNAIPQTGNELIPEKTLILEMGFEALNGVDFAKGCYMGQEVTARMKYRALIKKSLYRITSETPLPAVGAEIFLQDKSVGTLTSSNDTNGIAFLRDEAVEASKSGAPLTIDGVVLHAQKAQ